MEATLSKPVSAEQPYGVSGKGSGGKGPHLLVFCGLEKNTKRNIERLIGDRAIRLSPGCYEVDLNPERYRQLHQLLCCIPTEKGLASLIPLCGNCSSRRITYGLEGPVNPRDCEYLIV